MLDGEIEALKHRIKQCRMKQYRTKNELKKTSANAWPRILAPCVRRHCLKESQKLHSCKIFYYCWVIIRHLAIPTFAFNFVIALCIFTTEVVTISITITNYAVDNVAVVEQDVSGGIFPLLARFGGSACLIPSAVAMRTTATGRHETRLSYISDWTRVGHGLDPSMDWIGLRIGLEWVNKNRHMSNWGLNQKGRRFKLCVKGETKQFNFVFFCKFANKSNQIKLFYSAPKSWRESWST